MAVRNGIEQEYIDQALKMMFSNNLGSTYNSYYIEKEYLDQAIKTLTYNEPSAVAARQNAANAINELNSYAKQLQSIRDNIITEMKKLDSGENKSAVDFQTKAKQAQSSLQEILSKIKEKYEIIKSVDEYNTPEVESFLNGLGDYSKELNRLLSDIIVATQEEVDFENKSSLGKFMSHLGASVWAGINQYVESKYGQAEFLEDLRYGRILPGDAAKIGIASLVRDQQVKNLLLSDVKERQSPFAQIAPRTAEIAELQRQTQNQKIRESFQQAYENLRKIQDMDDNSFMNAVDAIIQSGVGLAGMALDAAVISAVMPGLGGAAANLSTAKSMIGRIAESMARNPAFWSSSLTTFGQEYLAAKDSGASPAEAAAAASLIGFVGGAIETIGGFGGGNIGKQTLLGILKDIASEGGEEVLQGITSNAIAKAIYDAERPLYSEDDENSIINFKRMLTEFGLGGVMGGLFGATRYAKDIIADKVAAKANVQQVKTQQPNLANAQLQGDRTLIATGVNVNTATQPSTITGTVNQSVPASTNAGVVTDIREARNYASSPQDWIAQNTDFNGEAVQSLNTIVNTIEELFGIPVSKGRISQPDAAAIYKTKQEAIRSRIDNALPEISHELGHHIDKLSGVQTLPEISEAISVFQTEKPDLYAQYTPDKIPGEAVAEFVRVYLKDRTEARNKYPTFYKAFVNTLDLQTLSKLDKVANMVNAYMTADNLERLGAVITNRGAKQTKLSADEWLRKTIEKIDLLMHDSAAPTKKVSDKTYLEYMQSLNSDGQVRYIIEEGMTDINGNLISDTSLSSILSELPSDKIRDFEKYLVAKHAIEWINNGKRVVADESLNNIQAMQEIVSKLENENPDFINVAEKVYKWQKELMKTWLVDTGIISQELYDKLWTMYPNYVPFFRNIRKDTVLKGGPGKIGKSASPIKTAKGSGLDLYSPIENIVINVDRFVKAANRNAIMQEIADAVNNIDGLGNIIEPVPADRVPKTVSTETARARLEAALQSQSLTDSNIQTVMDTFDDVLGEQLTEWSTKIMNDNDIVWAYIDGERQYFQVHDAALLNSLTAFGNKLRTSEFMRFFAAVNRVFKSLVTGGNPFFAIGSNIWRDPATAYVFGAERNPVKLIKDIFTAYGDVIKNTESYKRYKAIGATYASAISNPKEIASFMNDIYNADKSKVKRFFSSFVSVIEGIEHFADLIETAPRLAEFKRVLAKTGDAKQAAYAAAEVTVNFKRSGTLSKDIDVFYPYFNAQIQGLAKLAETAVKNPVGFALRAGVGLMVLSAIQMAFNHFLGGDDEYKKLSSYIKNNYYNFYVGNGKFIRIPKAQGVTAISTSIERAYEQWIMENPDAFYDYAGYLALQLLPPGVPNPVDGLKPLATDLLGIGSVAEVMANEDFKGSPIVPTQYQKLAPKMQYNDKTSWIAKTIGNMFNLSPMQIDHIINSNFGVLAKLNRALTAADADLTVGLSTQFIADNVYSTDITNRFYDEFDNKEIMKNSYPNNGRYAGEYALYNSVRSVLSVINNAARTERGRERQYKQLARDYALDFLNNTPEVDNRLIQLYERTKDSSVFYSREFSNKFVVDGEVKTLSVQDFLDYVEEYNAMVRTIYDNVLNAGISDDKILVKALEKAKSDVAETLKNKYVIKPDNSEEISVGVVKAIERGLPADVYLSFKVQAGLLEADKDRNGKSIPGSKKNKVLKLLDTFNLTPEQRNYLIQEQGYVQSNTKQSSQPTQSSSSSTDWLYNFWGGVLGGN